MVRDVEGLKRECSGLLIVSSFSFFLVMLVVTVMSKEVRSYLEERSYTFVATNITIRIFMENLESVMKKYDHMDIEMLRGTLNIRTRIRQRATNLVLFFDRSCAELLV